MLSWRDLALERGLGLVGRSVLELDETGDGALDALARGAERVVLVVPDGAARALVELKLAAVRELPVQSVRSFFGLGDFGRRVWFYHHVRGALPAAARAWWDSREERVRAGLAGGGRFGASLDRFRSLAAPVRPALDALCTLDPSTDRAAWLDQHLDGLRWRALLGAWWRLDGAPSFGPAPATAGGGRVALRVRRGLVRAPPGENPFARRWLGAGWPPEGNGAAWLDPGLLGAVRERLPRLQLVDAAPPGERFDHIDAGYAEARLVGALAEGLADGGRLVAWGLEGAPTLGAPALREDPTLGTTLSATARTLFPATCRVWRR